MPVALNAAGCGEIQIELVDVEVVAQVENNHRFFLLGQALRSDLPCHPVAVDHAAGAGSAVRRGVGVDLHARVTACETVIPGISGIGVEVAVETTGNVDVLFPVLGSNLHLSSSFKGIAVTILPGNLNRGDTSLLTSYLSLGLGIDILDNFGIFRKSHNCTGQSFLAIDFPAVGNCVADNLVIVVGKTLFLVPGNHLGRELNAVVCECLVVRPI